MNAIGLPVSEKKNFKFCLLYSYVQNCDPPPFQGDTIMRKSSASSEWIDFWGKGREEIIKSNTSSDI